MIVSKQARINDEAVVSVHQCDSKNRRILKHVVTKEGELLIIVYSILIGGISTSIGMNASIL